MNGLELEYDSLSRLVKRTDPLGAETVFAYDAASNRVSLTDAENNTTTWGYDGVGRVVKETNPLGDARRFAYDDAGMLSVRTDRLGRVVEFDYDDVGRPTAERWKTGGSTVNTLTFTYDPDGRVATAGDDHSRYAYQYDLNGGMTEVDNDGTPGVPRVVLTAEYNRIVERTSLAATVASTNDFLNSYGYDALGRPSSIAQDTHGGTSVAPKRVDFAYEVRGGYSTIDRYADLTGSSLVAKSAYGYDDFARLTSIEHAKGTTSLASHDYTFNAARLIDQHATVDGDSDYSYDDDAQLTAALHSFQADESYSYDLTGNRTNTGYSTGDANRLLSDGTYNYDYDAEGNRTQRTTIATGEIVEYAWDHRNRLTKVTFKNSSGVKTKEVEYVYDIHNLRIGKLLDSNGDGTVDDQWRFVYDPTVKDALADIVLVFDGSGDLRHRYLHGPDIDQVLAGEDASGDVLWPLADHLGTVRDLAEYDSGTDATTVVNHLKYDAFGRITGQSNAALTPLFSFTGRDWDGDATLFYYRARWYDAVVGRFVTEDPIGFDAGDENLYRYVLNSPVMVVDPTGEGIVVGGALAGCLQAAGLSAVTSWFSGDDFCTACCKGLVSCGFGAIGGAIAGALATSPNPRLAACAYSAGQGAAAGAAKGICTWACGRGGGNADITCGIIAGIANALLGCWLGSRVDAKTRKEAEVAINKALTPIVLQITGYDISKACKILAV